LYSLVRNKKGWLPRFLTNLQGNTTTLILLQICNENMTANGLLLEELHNDGKTSHLAHFIYLKSMFSNSRFYNYSQDRLAEKSKLSKSTIRKYVNFFLKNGWCKIAHKHLVFNKLEDLAAEKYRIRLKVIIRGTTVKSIKQSIIVHLLKLKTKRSEWFLNLRLDQLLCQKNPATRIMDKYPDLGLADVNIGETGTNGKNKVSYRKVAKWLNCGLGTAYNTVNSLCDANLMFKTKHGYRVLKWGSKKYEIAKKEGSTGKMFMSKRGFVIEIRCNSYDFAKCVA
jgi:transposase